MSDLFLGQTCTEAYGFVSFGTAHTFQFNFQPDKVVFNNLTQWAATGGNIPASTWWRGQTAVGKAYQQQVIVDNGTTGDYNFLLAAADGFTVADLPGGQITSHAAISAISKADPCVVTTAAPHGFQTNQLVRFTDLGDCGIVQHGMDQLNNNRYGIVVLSSTTFSLKDPVSGEPIDSTGYVTYVTGGQVTLETHVISLNNPQVQPYNIIPYIPNPYRYDPVTYQLTAGTAVMGAQGDVYKIEVYKWGQYTDLGTFLV